MTAQSFAWRRLRLLPLALSLLLGAASSVHAQSATATLIYPANGAVNADMTVPMQWTPVANVQAYYLYVGTTVGAKDLIDTGEIQQTSYLASSLLTGRTVYVRLWTKVGGLWSYSDSSFSAVPLVATLSFPANGATGIDPTQSMQWGAVPNAQAYYIYIGSAPGTKNLLDTGEIQQTSYRMSGLPSNQTLYVRLWTKAGGIWRSSDSTFSVVALVAVLTSPSNGAAIFDLTSPYQWTAVPNASAYYLYVGTTAGAKDLVDTGEIQQTSLAMSAVPAGQTIYARIWARVNGVWRYTDSTFTLLAPTATITSPLNGATAADVSQPIRWTTVTGAQAYYLYLGTTPGAKNLVDTGEIQVTQYSAPNLPPEQTVYARLWTKSGNVWRSSDSSFTVAANVAHITYPANGTTNADLTQPIRWTSVPYVQAYYLYVGTTLGAKDVVDTGEMRQTSWLALVNYTTPRTLYIRMWAKVNGIWRYSDCSFSTAPMAAEFTYPLDGATGVSTSQPFQWNAALNAQAYKIAFGTSFGANDLIETGELNGTSWSPAGLPPSGPIHARLSTKVNGAWSWHSDIEFSLDAAPAAPTMVTPHDGATHFDSQQPFEWSEVPLARAYRLIMGTTPGGSDLHDSGEVHGTQRFVPSLPLGGIVYGQVLAKVNGQWYSRGFSFTPTANGALATFKLKAALWATDVVRTMAADDLRPATGTFLQQRIGAKYRADSKDLALTLLQMLTELNTGLTARRLDVLFNPTSKANAHVLVEAYDPDTLRWLALDPTYDVTIQNADGWASPDAVSQATQTLNWGGVTYVFLGAAGDVYARAAAVDYPVLYLNVYHQGQAFTAGQGVSPLPYLLAGSLPASAAGTYMIQCASTAGTDVVINGVTTYVPCDGVSATSQPFAATTVAAPGGGQPAFQLFTVPRFVF